ncbi:MAG: DHH family phosphoesterase [Myxococcota bacterium]
MGTMTSGRPKNPDLSDANAAPVSATSEDAVLRALDQVRDLVVSGRRFVVSCHRRPDGDALGSALGLTYVLRAVGKEAVLYHPERLPSTLQFLGEIEAPETELPTGEIDGVFVTDTATPTLLPEPWLETTAPLVVIDHHVASVDFGDILLRDPDACSAGAVVLRIAERLGVSPLPSEAATPLYASMVADTGGFRYPNTTADVLRAAADLVDAGAEPWPVASNLFETWPRERMGLLSAVLATLEVYEEGAVATVRVTQKMMGDVGAEDDMVDGLVNYARHLDGVEIAALLWERPADNGTRVTKVSLRSQGRYDVSAIAMALGGGGHRAAAAAELPGTLDTIEARILTEARRLIGSTSPAKE